MNGLSSRIECPIIESERLVLRLLEAEDCASAIAYHRNNQDHLMPFGPKWPPDFFNEEFWTKQVETNKKEYREDKSARFFLFEKRGGRTAETVSDNAREYNNEVIGTVSFGGILRGAAQFCYLGYGLAKEKEKRGYMTEILREAIVFAFTDLKLHRVMANYIPTNEASGKILKRLGFTVEGYARDYLYLNGKWQDHILTSITNPDWRES
jgi:ribosomal-protein-alanine N-acetyltransferase